MRRGPKLRVFALALALVGFVLAAPVAGTSAAADRNPVIFVHGGFGSGAQFQSQQMRLTSNGYPQSHIRVLEYDSTFATEPRPVVYAKLDELIAEIKQQTGTSQVDILGHSRGTSVMQEYLNSSAERAADVAHYVNIDGGQADAPPGGVPTLAIWAGHGEPGRSIEGANNVTIPNQTHVEVATSEETFSEFYEFFTGRPPATSAIVREAGPIEIAGRAVLFPQNRGGPAIAVEIWAIDAATGHRAGSAPVATVPVDTDGAWGPVDVEPGVHYELALVRPGATVLHYYFEPFVRSDHLVRLLYSDAVESLIPRSERHASGLILRYKEFWGDQGDENDSLTIGGTSACNAATCPIDERINAVFWFDRGLDGQSDVSSPDPVFSELPFITAVDIFTPAARPPAGTVSVSLRSRGAGPVRTLSLPNFPSTTDGSVLQFHDFERTRRASTGGGDGGRNACRPTKDAIVGTGKNETLRGTKGDDLILAGGGHDKIKGRGGNDVICGGKGDDIILGGKRDDVIRGGADRDRIRGNKGRDLLIGNKGKDRVHGNRGSDRLIGNRGNDRLVGGKGGDRLRGNKGRDKLNGNGGRDRLHGNKGHDELRGGTGRDRCRGGADDDEFRSCERGG